MLEVIYRIYEVADEEYKAKNENRNLYELSVSRRKNIELTMDCKVCDSREHFKDLIREEYGNDIAFRYSKKLKAGQLYCIIIGEHCYNTERYFSEVKFKCCNCGAEVKQLYCKPIMMDKYTIKRELFGIEKYKEERFCSYGCMQARVEHLRNTLMNEYYENDEYENLFITKEMFERKEIQGYIYKITKKSTGEFYIGQTQYVPVFRWGQHLRTERFDIKNIEDYTFEVIYTVHKGENILKIEKEYIQKYYKSNPDLSLNYACIHDIKDESEK